MLHRQRLGDLVPMNTLNALVMCCCFRCDHPMQGEDGHGIRDCKHAPRGRTDRYGSWCLGYALGQCRPIWKRRLPCQSTCLPAGNSSEGATYVTSASSHPYTRPSVPRPVHVLPGFGPGLRAISVPDTSRASLTTLSDLASLMRTQTEAMAAMQLQMDNMARDGIRREFSLCLLWRRILATDDGLIL